MPHGEDHFTAPDGLDLYEQWWRPEGDLKAVVVGIHGINEHSGRYARLAADLNRHGYALHTMDLRGHGRSEGERAWTVRFDQYLDDAEVLIGRAAARYPGRPLFLFGHSMGGSIVALLGILRQGTVPIFAGGHHRQMVGRKNGTVPLSPTVQPLPLRGLILSAPAVLIARGLFPVLRRLAVVASVVWPKLRLVRMGCRFISRDPAVVEAFRRDPLVFHGPFPARTGAEILSAAKRIQTHISELRLPLLILHGTHDHVTDYHGSQLLYARAGSADKTLYLYPDFYHEVFSEPDREKPLADLLAWLDNHTPTPPRSPGC
jgi:acylglycerol lipase